MFIFNLNFLNSSAVNVVSSYGLDERGSVLGRCTERIFVTSATVSRPVLGSA